MKTVKDARYTMNHVKDRMWERYSIFIQDPDYIDMCNHILDRIGVKFISEEKQKKDVQQIYDMHFKGAVIRVVWSKCNRCIKTVLPIK